MTQLRYHNNLISNELNDRALISTTVLMFIHCSKKDKAIPLHAWRGPEGSKSLRLPEFLHIRYMNKVRLSTPRTVRLYPQGNIPGTHFCWRLNRSQGHSAAGRIMSMKISNVNIENRTRDRPACSALLAQLRHCLPLAL